MKKAAIYIRVSTEEQKVKGVSIEAQKDKLLNYIKNNGYNIDKDKHIFIDGGYSGASLDRPELDRMMKAAKSKEFDIVLVRKIDRFFRKTLYLLEYVEYLINFGVGFKSISEDFLADTSSGKMLLGIFGVIAELERDMIRERTIMGKLKKAEQGYFVGGGGVPFGYDTIKDGNGVKLKANKIEKEIINKIFELYVNDKKSLGEVAKSLEALGYKTRKNVKWNSSFISKIIKNEIYIGNYYYGKTCKIYDKINKKFIIKKSAPEKIIRLSSPVILENEELFYKAQELLEKNKRTKNNKNSHIFAGLIKCNHCGRGYYGYNTNKKTINYRCGGKMKQKLKIGEEKCINHEISEKFLVDTCWNKIMEVFSNPDKIIEKYYNEKSRNSNLNKYLKNKEKILKELKKREQGIVKLYEDIALSNDDFEVKSKTKLIEKFKIQKQDLEKEISKLDSHINSLKNKLKHLNNLKTLKEYYYKKINEVDEQKKIEIIKELVEKIIIYTNGNVKIIFKFQEINKDDDWRDFKNEERSFLKDEIDYDTDIGNNTLNKPAFFNGKSLMVGMAPPKK